MPVEIPIFDRVLDKLHDFDSKSVAAITGLEKPHVREIMFPRFWGVLEMQRQRLIAQAAEVLLVASDTTEFEITVGQEGYDQPSAFVWLTAGFKPPENSQKLGQYGKGAFKNCLPTDIEGHAGDVFISETSGKTVIWFLGRPHPNEHEGEPWANLILAHQYNMVKEHIRRRRVHGENPVVIMTYLAGAINGSEFKEGDLAVIGSDTELNAILAPGKGPRSIADKFFGDHFQKKLFRSWTRKMGALALQVAQEQGVQNEVGISAVIGTPEPTEFQEATEISLGEIICKYLLQMDMLQRLQNYLATGTEKVKFGASYDMGITFEQALFRQTLPGEQDIDRVSFVLHSDEVGVKKSGETSHSGNVDIATRTQKRNTRYLTGLLERIFQTDIITTGSRADFSIVSKLSQLPKEEKSRVIDWIVNRFRKAVG